MSKKNDGAAGVTGTTKKASKTAASEAPKVKTYKKLGDALAAFEAGETPRGTKLVIAAAGSVIEVTSRKGNPPTELYRFDGTPSQFATAVLKQVAKTKVRIEVIELPAALAALNPMSSPADDGE